MSNHTIGVRYDDIFSHTLAVAYQRSGSCWEWAVTAIPWTRSAGIKDMEPATHIFNEMWQVRIYYKTELSRPCTVIKRLGNLFNKIVMMGFYEHPNPSHSIG